MNSFLSTRNQSTSKKSGSMLKNLGENEWDLRERHVFDKVHIDMRDVYSDVQTSDDDIEEKDEEEEEYNKVFEDESASDSDTDDESEEKDELSEN